MKSRMLVFLLLAFLAAGLAAQPANRVVLVIIDGARYTETLGDTSGAWTPRMKMLAATGCVVDTMVNDSITMTPRAIPAIWTGSWATPIDTTPPGQLQIEYCATPTVWEYFRKAKGVDTTQAMYFIKYLTTPWLMSYNVDYGPAYWPWYSVKGVNDRDVWSIARAQMGTWHPALTVIYLPDVDHAAHWGTFTDYVNAISIADSIVGELWDFLQSDPIFAGHTTVFVTDDHGRHDDAHGGYSNHGDGCWGCRHVMLLSVGPAVRSGVHTSVPRRTPDITPTIGKIMSFPTPLCEGTVMDEILAPATHVTEAHTVPTRLGLDQNYPNPFNPTTTIKYQLPLTSNVSLKVFDLLGRELETLVQGEMSPGEHQMTFDATRYASGVYFYRLECGSFVETKKLIFLR